MAVRGAEVYAFSCNSQNAKLLLVEELSLRSKRREVLKGVRCGRLLPQLGGRCKGTYLRSSYTPPGSRIVGNSRHSPSTGESFGDSLNDRQLFGASSVELASAYSSPRRESFAGSNSAASGETAMESQGPHYNLRKDNFILETSSVAPQPERHTMVQVVDRLWETIRLEARQQSRAEPYLASFLYATIMAHSSLERSLAFHVANKLSDPTLLSTQLFSLFAEIFGSDLEIKDAIRADIHAFRERDPACQSYVHGMLFFKGFLACQTHRAAHRLWTQGRRSLALALQNRVSEVLQVDIHPGAKLGKGLLFDHATGVVIGETARVGDNVSILHHVTLGGTGACAGDRHPKVKDGVLIGAGATLLGPIMVGECAQIGASSLVLSDIPPFCTAVGVPARIIEPKKVDKLGVPGQSMDHCTSIIEGYYYEI